MTNFECKCVLTRKTGEWNVNCSTCIGLFHKACHTCIYYWMILCTIIYISSNSRLFWGIHFELCITYSISPFVIVILYDFLTILQQSCIFRPIQPKKPKLWLKNVPLHLLLFSPLFKNEVKGIILTCILSWISVIELFFSSFSFWLTYD